MKTKTYTRIRYPVILRGNQLIDTRELRTKNLKLKGLGGFPNLPGGACHRIDNPRYTLPTLVKSACIPSSQVYLPRELTRREPLKTSDQERGKKETFGVLGIIYAILAIGVLGFVV